ncbi:MAG TPA: hypothetical protein VEV82_11530, partial [Actinomycetota bacterium]|nr:hypothetical protein [Actinomycetota bacterium]
TNRRITGAANGGRERGPRTGAANGGRERGAASPLSKTLVAKCALHCHFSQPKLKLRGFLGSRRSADG